ncbi:PREDICTED: uncharacterized protein LOC104821458 [Tarenaya hassleriana]|uniref:uncharacterized protein LOC104821458 n=1 Tax=Tarenaya hassleriana TaxID=28532 RepID=UPI00053C6ED1|nr:PREDICTED: uncharacterized protein LOC104821458 [Tarenaya hassleriana]
MHTSRLFSRSPGSPSFRNFSTTVDLAAIAARVVEELRDQEPQSDFHADDFEFAFDCDHRRSDPIATADEIFCNGQIRPLNPYALFSSSSAAGDSSQVAAKGEDGSVPPTNIRHRRPPLRKLMREEQDSSCSPTTSDADEDLIGVSPESYCVWTPKRPTEEESRIDRLHEQLSSPSQREIKSSNGGSSKRWKLRSILLYAKRTSDGKEKFVIVTPVKNTEKSTGREEKSPPPIAGKCEGERNGKRSEDSKRRGYVPSRKDMVGILRNVNGISRHLRPF